MVTSHLQKVTLNIVDQPYSDFVVYVDESGDHSLKSIDPCYPVFVLSFCVFAKTYYCDVVTPSLRRLKFATFGHDMVILHEQDIRKKRGSFNTFDKDRRDIFLEHLNILISQTNFILMAVVIDKNKLKMQNPNNPQVYHLAMQLGLEKLYHFLRDQHQVDQITHIVCEARGRVEDLSLSNEFNRVRDGENSLEKPLPFELIIADKKTNSEGLQFADLAARPVGLSIFRPGQSNRAHRILEKKFHRNQSGEALGHGLHVYP